MSKEMSLDHRNRLDELKHEWLRAKREHPRIVIGVTVAFALAIVLPVVGAIWTVSGLRKGLPDGNAIAQMGVMNQATSVFDSKDHLAFTVFKEQRIEVPLSQVSPNRIKALIDIEDQRFYDHHGFDLVRIGSAAMANLRHRRVAQAGSTLTQQLARQSFLTPDKTIRRKLQELILAERIERAYTKKEILELYLNKVYFGDGLYGAEAASRGYFGKKASELSLGEASLLAGLLKAPSSYDPSQAPQKAEARQTVVLKAMLESKAITKDQYNTAFKTQIEIYDGLRAEEPYGQYFKDEVRRQLVEQFGSERVEQGGLKVYTTIDPYMQR